MIHPSSISLVKPGVNMSPGLTTSAAEQLDELAQNCLAKLDEVEPDTYRPSFLEGLLINT
jgi:hypothetical protein